jgi:hypothetical protein
MREITLKEINIKPGSITAKAEVQGYLTTFTIQFDFIEYNKLVDPVKNLDKAIKEEMASAIHPDILK